MTPKIKDKKLFGRNCIFDNFITRKFILLGVFLWIKYPDPVFSRIHNTGEKAGNIETNIDCTLGIYWVYITATSVILHHTLFM